MQILTEGFIDPRGPNACTSKCCKHGVYLDITERDEILSHADVIKVYFDETQTKDRTKWFDNYEELDSDFTSGKCVSTAVHNDKCVFLDKEGRCVLQVVEIEECLPRFSLKPFYCIIFPIVKVDGVFQYDDFCYGESACCTASKMSDEKMVEVCSNELQHALGVSKYKEVMTYYRNSLTDIRNQKISEDIQPDMSFGGKDAIDAGK